MRTIIVVMLLIFLILFIIVLTESFILLIARREKLGGNVKIVHVADLHTRKFGRDNKRLCDKIASQEPDVILISGDLVSRECTDFSIACETLVQLGAIAPVYMVRGNHEADLESEYSEKFMNIIKSSGITLLQNETRVLNINGRTVNICGLELKQTVYKKNESYKNLDTVELNDIVSALGEKPEGETILLVHNPLYAHVYAEWGADYAVSGHVHGGAVCIPFTKKGILSPERKFFPKYSRGVYKVGEMRLLLSGGLGKLRLFNPPEIVIYEI